MPYFACDADPADIREFPSDVEASAEFEEEYGYSWINGDEGGVREVQPGEDAEFYEVDCRP